MKIMLISSRLHFVSLGTGKIHAHDALDGRHPSYTGRYAYTTIQTRSTMCGRLIPTGTEPQVTRSLSKTQCCGSCWKVLSTYSEASVRIEREVTG